MALHTGVRSVRFGDGQLQFHTDEDAVGDDHQGKCQIKRRTGHQPFPQSRTHHTIHRHVAEMFSYLTIRRPSQNKINKLETWNWNWGIFIIDKPLFFHGVSIFLGFVVPPFGEILLIPISPVTSRHVMIKFIQIHMWMEVCSLENHPTSCSLFQQPCLISRICFFLLVAIDQTWQWKVGPWQARGFSSGRPRLRTPAAKSPLFPLYHIPYVYNYLYIYIYIIQSSHFLITQGHIFSSMIFQKST